MRLDLVDVFASTSLSGNPLGVVHAAQDLDESQMLALTQWLGFSETTFLLPPSNAEADYRVRIFYPAGELPFAGHPTLGSCHAWLEAGGVAKRRGMVVQECGIGLVEVRQDGGALAFKAPPMLRYGPLDEAEMANAIRVTGTDPEAVVEGFHIANGPDWKLLRLESAQDVLAAEPATKAPVGTEVGLAGPAAEGSGFDWELRAFFANQHGAIVEDPVTGSFNAGVAMHLFGLGLAKGSYIAAQGRKTGADGRVQLVCEDDGGIWVGGKCVTIARGAALPSLS